ncbi:hypothetical protein [Gorillibacterium sp. sgz5001074]|uniref:hypothetical protein n=1 Tax=Gorillibacterium sp. sgz5001074 TaxID=3446695 RepID=UPI003F66DA58
MSTLKKGQSIVTDNEFEAAIKEKELVYIIDGGIIQRRPAYISGWNTEIIYMSDGAKIRRSGYTFRTLTEEEAAAVETNATKK